MAKGLARGSPAPDSQDPTFAGLMQRIGACRACAVHFTHEPRPVLQGKPTARLCIVGQAPGTRVHATGVPFNDASGDRLRAWLDIPHRVFYDEARIAILPMGFCFPGQDGKGGDRPPRPECARLWRDELLAAFPRIDLTLLVGQYAQRWHLGARAGPTLTETVARWRDYGPDFIPLPHPSWRNNGWIKAHPWFAKELLPALRRRVHGILEGADDRD